MMALNLYVLLTSIGAILTLLAIKFFLYLRTLPPGPFPLPFVGSLYALNSKSAYERQFASWSQKYGGIISVWFGFTPVFVVNDWKLIHEGALVKRDHFIDRHKTISMKMINGKRRGISADDGEAWHVLRRVAIIILRRYSGSIRMAENVKWGVDEAFKKNIILNQPFNPNELMFNIMQNVSFAALLGQRTEDDEDLMEMRKFPPMIREGFSESLWSDSIPIYRLFNKKPLEKLQYGVETFVELLKNNIKKHKLTFQKDDVKDFTDALLASKDQYEDEMKDNSTYLTEANIAQVMLELFQGGSDTTAVTLIWLSKLLAHHQEIQVKLFQEISANIGDRDITQEDRENCPYTQAVIMETLRLCNVATSGFLRRANIDTELGGYLIPKGSVVLFNNCAPSMDPTLWPEPKEFRPERFIDSTNGGIAKIQFPGYLSFGLGKRACPGERLAMMHLFLIVARLLRCYRLMPAKGQEKMVDMNTEPLCIFAFPKPFQIIMVQR